jgi:NADH-quinone oxidoreductase subunit E
VSQPEDRQQGTTPEPGRGQAPESSAGTVPPDLYEAVQLEIAKYPNRRAAILPALRLAQERYGWLSPEALQAVADAIDFSPAYCQSVASFYDMFFLEPVGTHVIEVCTNIACALCGAGEVMAAFEEALGIREGGTTEDGTITLRKVECLGGCPFAPIVAVDERFHEQFKPEDAAALAEEVRRRPRVAHG